MEAMVAVYLIEDKCLPVVRSLLTSSAMLAPMKNTG